MKPSILALLLALAAGAAQASGLADDDSVAHKAICKAVGQREPPAAHRPTPAQSKALAKCDAEALYYGEVGPPDYVKARLCALKDGGAADDQSVFNDDVILMQIYANGRGVPRDMDLAIAYACKDDAQAPAEFTGRLDSLIARRAEPDPKPFDYCDDITSGYMEGMCAARDSQIADKGRAAGLDRVAARLPPAARAPFGALKTAAAAFASAHGDGEVDLSGTGRAAFEIEAEDAARTAFQHHLDALLNHRWPAASPTAARKADAELNAAYRATLAAVGKGQSGTVEPRGVRDAQRRWLAYRDAFVAFAKAAAPGVDAPSVLADLTRERTRMLREIAS